MRLIIIFILSLLSFQTYAYCSKNGNFQDPMQVITINLNQGSVGKTSETENQSLNFTSGTSFNCFFLSSNVVAGVKNEQHQIFKVSLGDKIHYAYVSVNLKISSDTKNIDISLGNYELTASKLNQSSIRYKVEYRLLNKSDALTTPVTIDNEVDMNEFIGFTEGLITQNSINQRIKLKFKFTETTCGFMDNSVTVAPISWREVLDARPQSPVDGQPEFICNTSLGFATSNIKYKFESDSNYDYVLNNEQEYNSAGNVGFEIYESSKGGDSIVNFRSNEFELFSRGDLVDKNKLKLSLKFKYKPYGDGKYSSGLVKSRVRIVTYYD